MPLAQALRNSCLAVVCVPYLTLGCVGFVSVSFGFAVGVLVGRCCVSPSVRRVTLFSCGARLWLAVLLESCGSSLWADQP